VVFSTGAVYHFGDADNGNLLGTIKSLDELGVTPLNCTLNANITVHDEQLHCAWALISRGGWTLQNDQDNYMLDSTSQWWSSPNTDQVDSYFFGHGSDYLGALSEVREALTWGGVTAFANRWGLSTCCWEATLPCRHGRRWASCGRVGST
jgi:hypothetical protein